MANPSARDTEWLLEAAYPSLDYVDLFVPRATGGFEQRQSGDRVAFRKRDVAYRNVVFSLNEPAHGARTYYLRVQTSGSMLVPLLAWSPRAFLAHTNSELPVLWMFYGLMLVMVCYNAFLFLAVRERDYVFYCLYIASYALFQFSLNGHASQYLFPERTWVANQMLLLAAGSAFFWSAWFHRSFLQLKETLPRADRWLRWGQALCAAIVLYTFFGSYSTCVRILAPFGLVLTGLMLANAALLFRRGFRPAKLYTLAWAAFHVGIALFILKTLGVLASNWLMNSAILHGASLEILLLSLALADRINAMRAKLGVLNQQLSSSVQELEVMLVKAEAATQAKSKFLATVSHELRTPLNVIINIPSAVLKDFPECDGVSCSGCHSVFELEQNESWQPSAPCPECGATGTLVREKVRRYSGAPEETAQHLGYVERAGKHLLQVVNSILDFSKMEAGKLTLDLREISVKALVEDAIGPLGELAKQKRLRVEFELDESPLSLKCDPLRVRQVLTNLVGNAIKFSEGPGRIEVSARGDGDWVEFQVADQGIGIPAADRELIFESFQQAHRGDDKNYGGTGLGLSISRSLVEMHGGRIWLRPNDGPGSTFCFALPKRGPDAKTETGATRREAPSPEGKRQLIAYVEDDDDNWLVAKLHVAERYELVRASNAREACRLFIEFGAQLTAVLMDVELRGSELDGVELTLLLRGRLLRTPLPEYAKAVPKLHVPVIFVTAHGADAAAYRLNQAGAAATIHKPVMFNTLNLAIAEVHLKRTRDRKPAPTRAR